MVDAGGDVFEGLLIDLRRAAIRIGDIPVFDFIGLIEDRVAAPASEIDDQVGGLQNIARDGFGGESFGGIAVGLKDLQGCCRNVAEREKAGAGGIEDIGGIAAGDGFGDGAAAGVAEAEEEDAETFGSGHGGIVAWKIGREIGEEKAEEKRYRRGAEGTEERRGRKKRLAQRPQRTQSSQRRGRRV